ncbi:hypothetical protein [uncultured Nostoc sp.]
MRVGCLNDVKIAVQRGIEYVLTKKQSYILDMRIAKNTPPLTAPSTEAATKRMLTRYCYRVGFLESAIALAH